MFKQAEERPALRSTQRSHRCSRYQTNAIFSLHNRAAGRGPYISYVRNLWTCLNRPECRAMVSNHCKPSSQTELVLREGIPQNDVPQLARSTICGLHLRRSCTVVAGRPKPRSSWREERGSVRELDWDVVRTMMAKVKTRLRNVVDKSPLSLLKFHLNTPEAI